MKGKLNLHFDIEENNNTLECCNIDVYINCINEEMMEKVKGGMEELCESFKKVIKSNIDN